MRIPALVIAALALTMAGVRPAPAQRLERTIDLTQFHWGPIDATPVETDGIPWTEEWAVKSLALNEVIQRWRVVAVRAHGLCVGDWFTLDLSPWQPVDIDEVGAKSKLIIRTPLLGPTTVITVISLDTPPCI